MSAPKDSFLRFSLAFAFLSAALGRGSPLQAAENDSGAWPSFRGPNSSGHATTTNQLPLNFGPGQNEAWQIATPKGHSSPCVSGGRIFLTGVDEPAKRLQTLSIRQADGKVLWNSAIEVPELEKVHQVSNQAAATCATDGRLVVSCFGSFGLVCHDFSGVEKWRAPMRPFQSVNGSGTSPVIDNGVVYLNREDSVEQVLVAIDLETGREKWTRKHANAKANSNGVASTPVVWNRELVLHRSGSVSAFDSASGEPLWSVPARTTGCGTPVIADGKLVVATWTWLGEPDQVPPWPEFAPLLAKYDSDKNGKLGESELPKDLSLSVRPGVSPELGGNVSFRSVFGMLDDNHDGQLDADEWAAGSAKIAAYQKSSGHGVIAIDLSKSGAPSGPGILWKVERNVPEVPSPLIQQGRVYLVRNGGVLMCVNLADGKILYQERLGPLGPYYASPIEAAGVIYIAAGNGRIVAINEGPAFQILATNDLKESLFATPAAVGNDLLIRSEKHLFAFRR